MQQPLTSLKRTSEIPDPDFSLAYRKIILPSPDSEPKLARAILHVTAHPGSFTRCRIAWQTGYLCGLGEPENSKIAIAIEYFHTASLIFDDLSCMDDAETRRGVACVHVIFGEATAMLAALAFFNKAYAILWETTAQLPATQIQKVTRLVDDCLGTSGVLSGQNRDLSFANSGMSADEILRIAAGKTATLLKLALCLPAIIAGADDTTIELLSQLSYSRGLGYQIADDFKDIFLSIDESGKSNDRDRSLSRPNIVACEGVPAAAMRLDRLVKQGDAIQQKLINRNALWIFLDVIRITVGPELISKNGMPATVAN